ncbi:RING finger protein unkempt-like isoform X2 [Culex pipiens pallens]|uniref:RING finger protein unkempt-like isoform X2 n=1 Tax=Culex pipiens pallens TaxID=42434 RepID=UPI0019548EC8|nr:RING finger protein unkempt-like isoform X2 [Culex pipiens pallens]
MASSDPKGGLLSTQTEKPNHYTFRCRYLKEFRVEQCPSFLQHKCNQHRPFICFNWHFMNQRRRRPVRRRDGSFNYSADNYCTKYDETTGICPDGDDCPFLHRTAGDTERRYHLRYYKTCMCVHDTDARGYCVKNGQHCAFAHGIHDQRPPVYDIKELEALQAAEASGECLNGPNVLDKERNLMNEDPKWQDTNYVLANYKTEPCKRPPRLCRQGYACPQYHNSKDKRRSPRKYKYRSTPCPNVKHGEEWGEPANCEAGDNCQYCHTRTEQQFHPEIYKSTKCNDVQQAGYCPRSVFCAFAHVEPYVLTEELTGRDLDSQALALSDMISSVLPPDNGSLSKKDKHELALLQTNGSGAESSESASTSSLGSNHSNSHNKAPGSQLQQNKHNNCLLGGAAAGSATAANCNGASLQATFYNNGGGGAAASSLLSNNFPEFTPELRAQLLAIDNDLTMGPLDKEQRKRMCYSAFRNFASSLDGGVYDMGRRDPMHGLDNSISAGIASSGLLASSSAPVNIPGSPMANSISGLLQGTSAPVNIPGSSLSNNFSPSSHSNLFGMSDAMFGGGGNTAHHIGSSSAPKLANSFGHNNADSLFFQSHIISPVLTGGDGGLSASPELSRISELNSLNNELSNNNTNLLFDNHMQQAVQQQQQQQQQQQMHQNQHQHQHAAAAAALVAAAAKSSNSNHPYSMSPLVTSEMGRLREELANKNAQMMNWEVMQATNACEAWKAQMEESNRKTVIAEQQRDEALSHVKALKEKMEHMSITGNSTANFRTTDFRGMPLQKLKNIQAKLRAEIEEVEKVLYLETATKCMKCEENNRSVTLVPCNHYVLCDSCAVTQRECPYCQTPVTSQA